MDVTKLSLAELRELELSLGEEDQVNEDLLGTVCLEIDKRVIGEFRANLAFAANLAYRHMGR